LQFKSRRYITGLRGAAHLNGREGVILRVDPRNCERLVVQLTGGEEVSVKDANCSEP